MGLGVAGARAGGGWGVAGWGWPRQAGRRRSQESGEDGDRLHLGHSSPWVDPAQWVGLQPCPVLAPHPHFSAPLNWPAGVSHSASPSPGPQAHGFASCRESRGSFQSCSELDALPRASWSVSRRPGLGGSHTRAVPTSALAWDFRPVCSGSPGCPRPGHLSPHVGLPPHPLLL